MSTGVTTVVKALPYFLSVGAAAGAYGAYRFVSPREVTAFLISIATAPGKYSRLAILLFILANLKSLPLAWTVSSLSHPFSPSVVG